MRVVRAAAHVHSEWSYDGRWTLDQIANAFGRLRYDVVLLAEHDRGFDEARWAEYKLACAAASTPATLLVPGIEYSDPTNSVHIPVWGATPFLGEGLETRELLTRVNHVDGFAVLAHPSRRGAWNRLPPGALTSLLGVELWNRKYDGYAPSRAGVDLLRSRAQLVPMVSLDFHTARQFHPLAMLLELDGDLGLNAIYDAMGARRLRPMALGFPAESLARGTALRALSRLERSRKGLAATARRAGRG